MRKILSKGIESLAIIPARGGSKGIPGKNTRPLNGKPLIAWTIDAAHSSKRVNRVIVSTDSPEIMKIAMDFGADVPFQRPMELAKDDTPGVEPILHAVRWLIENEGYHPDLLCCLQPTSPFRTGDDIDQAISLIIQKNADSVISIAPLNHNPNWMQVMDRNGRLTDFISGGTAINNRQEMDTVYELNGAIYLIRTDVLLENHTFFLENTYGYVMPQERSLDIDTPWDFRIAEMIAKDI